jgi:hypothetical protein
LIGIVISKIATQFNIYARNDKRKISRNPFPIHKLIRNVSLCERGKEILHSRVRGNDKGVRHPALRSFASLQDDSFAETSDIEVLDGLGVRQYEILAGQYLFTHQHIE